MSNVRVFIQNIFFALIRKFPRQAFHYASKINILFKVRISEFIFNGNNFPEKSCILNENKMFWLLIFFFFFEDGWGGVSIPLT